MKNHDIFEHKDISPMLLTDGEPFDHADFVYEIKYDGARAFAYLEDGAVEIKNKSGKSVTKAYPELSGLWKSVKSTAVLDGEIVVFSDGIPDFAAVQGRWGLTDPLRIERASYKKPVTFVAFDLLYLNGENLMRKPLIDRKETLCAAIEEGERLKISRHAEHDGVKLFDAAVRIGLEGIVAKRRDSVYKPGVRSKDWIKFKALSDEEFIIAGYSPVDGKITSLALASYGKSGALVYRGGVAATLGTDAEQRVKGLPGGTSLTSERADTVWVVPALCCAVKYLQRTENNTLRQPVFKGMAPAVSPEECVLR